MKKIFLYAAIMVASSLATSCQDFLDEYSKDLVVAKNVTHLNELLIGDVYLRSHQVDNGMSAQPYAFVNMLDDDINTAGTPLKGNVSSTSWRNVTKPMFGFYAWQQDVRYNSTGTSKIGDDQTWNKLYQRINNANNIIDIIDDMPHQTKEDEALYHRVKGEAHFTRAQFYFALVNLYGQPLNPETADTTKTIPLKLTPYVEHDKDKETQFELASQLKVYQQIVGDLKIACEELTLSPQPMQYHLHRASAEAALILLSRVYLYMQEWTLAEAAAEKVMSTTNYRLTAIVADKPFLTPDNKEIIFSQGANYVAPRNLRVSLTAAPAEFCVTRDLYDLFDDTDTRKTAFFAVNSDNDSIQLTNKYERGLELNHISDGWMIRLSEAYLNHAEACTMLGKQTKAIKSYNELRQMRIENYMEEDWSNEELIQAIRDERRRELCFEGHRWFDLRRYGENKQYPLQKTIVHVFNVFSDEGAYENTLLYALPPKDAGYTFAIPNSALEFDKVPMVTHIRPKRKPLEVEEPINVPEIPTTPDENEKP